MQRILEQARNPGKDSNENTDTELLILTFNFRESGFTSQTIDQNYKNFIPKKEITFLLYILYTNE